MAIRHPFSGAPTAMITYPADGEETTRQIEGNSENLECIVSGEMSQWNYFRYHLSVCKIFRRSHSNHHMAFEWRGFGI